VWVPGIALAWDLTTTMTASWQKVFSGNPKIGYFEQRGAFQDSIDRGEVLAPATTLDQMEQIVFNSTLNGVLQATFALLTLTVVLSAIPVWMRAVRSGGLPTTEVPHQTSDLVAPSDFFATAEEKAAVRDWEESRRVSGTGGRR
jgi:carbon starvation protein